MKYETKEFFSKRLAGIMKDHGESQYDLSKIMGVSQSTVSAWCTGDKMPRMDKIEKIAQHYGIAISSLIAPPKADTNTVPFVETNFAPIVGSIPAGYPALAAQDIDFAPIVGSIPAGYPALAAQDIEGYATIPYKDAENYFFLRVKGDSMVNAGIREGDLVLIRKQACADNGQIVAARVNGDEATLKRYKQSGDTIVLLPENPVYDPQIVPAKDFAEGQAQIIGVALEVRHTL